MRTRHTLLTALAILLLATPAFASDDERDQQEASSVSWMATHAERSERASKRPALLLPLYVSAGALQALDVYTTSRGLRAGAYEANPAIRNGNVGTTLALKAATTGVSIFMAEKLWRKNKAAAILTVLATNVVGAAVVANNYRIMAKLEP
jgi:hypothetical protein